MRQTLLFAVLAGALALGSTAASAGWSRHGTLTTPRGTYSSSASGGCAGGTCSRSGEITGPAGRTVSGNRTITRTAPGQFSSSGTVTGPNGGTVTRNGETSCANGTCTHSGTITGPNGGSVTTNGSVTATPP